MSTNICEAFLALCRRELSSGVGGYAAKIGAEHCGGSGRATFCFVIGDLETTVILDRGGIDCSFSPIESKVGSVFFSQIAPRYGFNTAKAQRVTVIEIFEFVRENIVELLTDFAALKAGNVHPRFERLQFTPPLDVLSNIARKTLEKGISETRR